MLFEQSGLLGVSGVSGDVRVLLASRDPYAREALDLFTYRIACEAAAMATAVGGIDGLVFTAGVGQHAPPIRADVCRRVNWLGVELDEEANQHALHRSWFFDPELVHVKAKDGKVTLTGKVSSLHDRETAGMTAWAAYGATSVENDIVVS